jgi:predicted enzyme related to lactoylglutathione lyase
MGNPVTRFQIISKAPDETAAFYCSAFGWRIDAQNPLGYREIQTGSSEGIHGGIWPAPPQVANFVQLFVSVDDVKQACEKAQSLGATVLIAPTVLPAGEQMAVLQDPAGMPFAVWQAS